MLTGISLFCLAALDFEILTCFLGLSTNSTTQGECDMQIGYNSIIAASRKKILVVCNLHPSLTSFLSVSEEAVGVGPLITRFTDYQE